MVRFSLWASCLSLVSLSVFPKVILAQSYIPGTGIAVIPNISEDVREERSEEVTPTPQPTPSSPPSSECPVSQVDFRKVATADYHTRFGIQAAADAKDSCLMDVIISSFNTWGVSKKSHHFTDFSAEKFRSSGKYSINEGGNAHKWSDDAVIANIWTQLLELSGTDRTNYQANKQYLSCSEWGNAGSDSQGGRIGGGNWDRHIGWNDARQQKACFTGKFYIDSSSCNLVPIREVDEVCTAFSIDYTASTPVSLILDESSYPLANATAVDFKLDPSSSKRIWEWRASEKAPLLVYDPEKRRNVTSAEQLFGNWTFGGKKTASLNGVSPTKWDNGFEALKSLDQNSDGELSGGELEQLALWFDSNRDGVSQQGEVTSLFDSQIVSLNVSDPVITAANGDLEIARGFERIVDGVVHSGKMVDWIGKGTDSVFDLVSKLSPKDETNRGELPRKRNLESSSTEQATTTSPADDASGVWVWSIESDSERKQPSVGGQGLFVLINDGSNRLAGQTFVQKSILAKAEIQASKSPSVVEFTKLDGKAVQTPEGLTRIEFTSMFPGVLQRSEALIAEDGLTMKGKSVLQTPAGTSISYTWEAKKRK